jgi:3-hydroxyisobutyrate dehydrogenase-like beta-hydroxyacid dehydrogenase
VSAEQVAFIGVGTMGAAMARRLLSNGSTVVVCDPSAAACDAMRQAGAAVATTPAEAGADVEVALLSLPGPEEVEQVVTGADGLLTAGQPPSTIVDFSTNAPTVVVELRAACAERGVTFVDAPVSGGLVKAETGELAIMVGAEPHEFEAITPLLTVVGSNLFHVGPSGSGTVAKLVNNQLFLAAAVAVQEAYLTGAALGMDPNDLHPIIAASSGGVYAKLAPLLLGRRFDDVIFRLDIAAKDLALAVEAANRAGVSVPTTTAAAGVYADAVDAGSGDQAFHATLAELERQVDGAAAGIEVPPLVRKPRR